MLKRLDPDELAAATSSCNVDGLRHVSDAEPGIRRMRAGKGFWYRHDRDGKVSQAETLDRIRKLAIPPAWTDVWIAPIEDGHIQATGRDVKGRKQYRYHTQWSLCRGDVKFSSLADFADALPALRTVIDADLRRHGLPREKVLASIVWLLDNTMIRVGNATYARDNKSFGLTTLRSRHASVAGSRLRFEFLGKSGKQWKVQLVDRRIARIVKSIQELPGQALFQYLDEDGQRRRVGSQDVNAYLREACGEGFTSKHFRTWGGTLRALALFSGTEVPETKTGRARTINETVDRVAARLGNTRAVCRSCYIHPRVLESWQEGRLAEEVKLARRRFRKPIQGLDETETLLRHWLRAPVS